MTDLREEGPQTGIAEHGPLSATITGLVREELERNNRYFEFAQNQIEKDRGFYKHLYSYAVGFLAFMVVVTGYFQYHSVDQMRSDMQTSVDAEIKRDSAQMEALRAQATEVSTDAQSTVNQELADVRTQVQRRIDTEFQSDNITTLVAAAARERTGKELAGIIQTEVSAQVAKGIQEQNPVIRQAVEEQTKQAVKDLQPTISSAVDKATTGMRSIIYTRSRSVTCQNRKTSTYGP